MQPDAIANYVKFKQGIVLSSLAERNAALGNQSVEESVEYVPCNPSIPIPCLTFPSDATYPGAERLEKEEVDP